MTFYVRYVLTDGATVSLPELAADIKQINSGYEAGADFFLLDDEELGLIAINAPGDGLFEDDIALLNDFAEQKNSRERLHSTLARATSLITVQVLHITATSKTQEQLEPLFHWLLANHPGLLVVEGGSFYDSTDPVP